MSPVTISDVHSPWNQSLMTVGNIALRLEAKDGGPSLLPQPKAIYLHHPTLDQCTKVSLMGKVFYEIHPQLWGQGLMSEAFSEMLRFAFEEVGCTMVEVRHRASSLTRRDQNKGNQLTRRNRQTQRALIQLRSKYARNTG